MSDNENEQKERANRLSQQLAAAERELYIIAKDKAQLRVALNGAKCREAEERIEKRANQAELAIRDQARLYEQAEKECGKLSEMVTFRNKQIDDLQRVRRIEAETLCRLREEDARWIKDNKRLWRRLEEYRVLTETPLVDPAPSSSPSGSSAESASSTQQPVDAGGGPGMSPSEEEAARKWVAEFQEAMRKTLEAAGFTVMTNADGAIQGWSRRQG